MILYIDDPTSTTGINESGVVYRRIDNQDGFAWEATAAVIKEWLPSDYRAKAIRKARRER